MSGMREVRGIRIPKQRPSLLPWAVGLIIFVFLLWLVADLTRADELETARKAELEVVAGIQTSPLG